MRLFLIAHGFVQGVGYRNFVRVVAKKHGVTGFVRNVKDGSVEIFASGSETSLQEFENEIKVSDKYGPQVMNIEKIDEDDDRFPKGNEEYTDFLIQKDKKL